MACEGAGDDGLALTAAVVCVECGGAASMRCPRCREPLCAEHFAAASPWCAVCGAELDERLQEIGPRRAAAVAAGALGGGVASGIGALLVCAAIAAAFPGTGVLTFWLFLLGTMGGVLGGARAGSRIIDRREHARFLDEAAPPLPTARLVK